MKKILAVFLMLLSISVFVYAEENTTETPAIPMGNQGGAMDQKFQGFNLQGYKDDGGKAWDVKGDTANIEGTQITLSNVNANAYGEQNVNVTAEKGVIDQVSGEMKLENDVVMTSDQGSQLFTDSLEWNRSQDLVKTEDEVIITDPAFRATGKGMEAKPGLKNAKINEDVRVSVDTTPAEKDPQTVVITSDGPMTIDQSKRMAKFEDNVVAIQKTDGRTLKANTMEVYFDEEMKQITKMICLGNVEIVQGENKSYAEEVVYDAAEQKLTLKGKPKIQMVMEGKGAPISSGD